MTCAACGAVADDSARFCAACGSPLRQAEQSRESRKKVSILFMDIVGSTELAEHLDPEPLRQIMDRYFALASAAIAEHGGVVEKFIGDAVMAVFGAMVAREDDALRAVRAASAALAGLRELSAELAGTHQVGLEARCGICTGDVMVITAGGVDFRVVGDAVNTAARLETAAAPGKILVDADTAALVRGHIALEAVEPLALKGKAQAVPAWRVEDGEPEADDGSVLGAVGASAVDFVGRVDELEELRHVFGRVARQRRVSLVTVVGAPGIGKSRLVQEFLGGLPEDTAVVLAGRCSAYGRGITYKPLAEALESVPGGWSGLAGTLAGDSEAGRRAVDSLASVVGTRPEDAETAADREEAAPHTTPQAALQTFPRTDPRPAPGPDTRAGVEEIAWAVRHLLEVLGRERPVVLVWEDLHWAEATMLDLIDDVAAWLTDVPVLLLCVARTELLESRLSWGGGKASAMTLEVGPLGYEQSAALVSELALRGEVYAHEYDDVYSSIAARCDGNPLFIELMVDVFTETAPDIRIPPTVHALLGARLDQLPESERQAVEMAATIGREFGRDALGAVARGEGVERADLDERLARLVRWRVVRRDGPSAYRFTQGLLRDTAYAFTPKVRRERWHTMLAEWFAGAARDPLTFAHHVETASLLRRDLRPGERGRTPQEIAAADVLIAEGMNALHRKDLPAAAGLLERGKDLLPSDDPRHATLVLHISDSWLGLWDADRTLAALAAAEQAQADDPRVLALCAVQRCIAELRLGRATPADLAERTHAIAADLAADPDDDLSWGRWHQLVAYLHLDSERAAQAEESFRAALRRARAVGDRDEEDRLLCALCELAQWAPSPVAAGLDLCAQLVERFAANRALLVPVLVTRAHLSALSGDLDAARAALATAGGYTGDLHLDLADAAVMAMSGFVAMLAEEHGEAEEHYRRAATFLRNAGAVLDAQTLEAAVAREVFAQGRVEEAVEALDRLDAEGDGSGPGLRALIGGASLRARIASEAGRHGDAVAFARGSVDLVVRTDDLTLEADVLAEAARVLWAAGLVDEAVDAGDQALRMFELKGAALPARRMREFLRRVVADPAVGDEGSSGVPGVARPSARQAPPEPSSPSTSSPSQPSPPQPSQSQPSPPQPSPPQPPSPRPPSDGASPADADA